MRFADSVLDRDTNLVDTVLARRARVWVTVLAGVGLFLELAVIRWHAGLFPALAFFKNMSMFSCFLGLGLGYGLSKRRVAFTLVPALLAVEFSILVVLHNATDLTQMASLVRTLPMILTREWQGVGTPAGAYAFTASVFVGNALVFIPIGQATGRLMRRLPTLTGYGLNLLGSILGIVVFFALSALWMPPTVWVLVVTGVFIVACGRIRQALVRVIAPVAVLIVIMQVPTNLPERTIYGPYQLVSYGIPHYPRIWITANHAFQQRIPDTFRQRGEPSPYDLPYQMLDPPPREILIVGGGAGNDAAAAIRTETADLVHVVEIDPVIARLGRRLHPEGPYKDWRVRVFVTDARAYFRHCRRTYDLVVFSLLDAHTALSSFASFRMDTFVYTRESFRSAARLLRAGGCIYVMFDTPDDRHIRKIHQLLRESVGTEPLALVEGGGAVPQMLLARKGQPPDPAAVPAPWSAVQLPDFTASGLDLPTDDWPFLYLARRRFPPAYVPLIAIFLAITAIMILVFLGRRGSKRAPGQPGALHFFFLGAGFMLIEAKGITELALTFGSTWQVIGAVIVGILLLSFIGNALVDAGATGRRMWIWYILLMASLAAGYFVRHDHLARWMAGEVQIRVMHVLLLTLPVLFASIIFSSGFRDGPGVERVLSANLFGAICGGFAEYAAVALGYRALYVLAAGFYLLSGAALVLARAPLRGLLYHLHLIHGPAPVLPGTFPRVMRPRPAHRFMLKWGSPRASAARMAEQDRPWHTP